MGRLPEANSERWCDSYQEEQAFATSLPKSQHHCPDLGERASSLATSLLCAYTGRAIRMEHSRRPRAYWQLTASSQNLSSELLLFLFYQRKIWAQGG